MVTSLKSKTLDELLAEADELIRNFNANFLQELEEGKRLEFQQHSRRLEELKSAARQNAEKKENPPDSSWGEGIHLAVLDIVKAMKELSRYFS